MLEVPASRVSSKAGLFWDWSRKANQGRARLQPCRSGPGKGGL